MSVKLANIRSQHAGRRRRWNRARINRLCNVCRITEPELVAYLDWDRASFRRAYAKNTFPGPVCIVLDLMESYAFRIHLGEQIDFDLPFPEKTT